jgi:hypothetical protein
MPTVTNPNLTLTTSEGQVTVRVRYDATFTPFERKLAELGLTYHSHITVHGIDDTVVGPSIVAVDFPTRHFPITPGSSDLVLPRDESETVGRGVLQEDPGAATDELKAKIYIHADNFPLERTEDTFTDEEILLG